MTTIHNLVLTCLLLCFLFHLEGFSGLILNSVLYDLLPLVCACLPPNKSNKKGFSKRILTGENVIFADWGQSTPEPNRTPALLPRLVPEVRLNFFCLLEHKKKRKKPLWWVSDSISIYRCVCVNTHQCVCVCVMRGWQEGCVSLTPFIWKYRI